MQHPLKFLSDSALSVLFSIYLIEEIGGFWWWFSSALQEMLCLLTQFHPQACGSKFDFYVKCGLAHSGRKVQQ